LLNASLRRVLPAYLTLLLWNTAWSMSITGPVLPLYIEALGIGIVGWSALAAAFAVGMFLFEWVWGSLSDRTERLFLMVPSVLGMSVLFALYTFHGSFSFFLVLQLLSGAVGVVIGPTTRSYVSEGSPEKSIGLYASLWWAFSSLGVVIGPLIGTYVAQTWSFEYSFYASCAISLILAFVILMSFPRNRHRRRGSSRSIIYNLKTVLRRRSAGFLFLSAIFALMSFSVVRAFLPLYASGRIGMSTIEVGTLIATISAAQLVAMPVLGWLSDRFGRKRTAVVGFTLSSCAFLLYFLAGTSFQVFLVSIAVGIGLSGMSLLLAMIPDVTPSTMYGTAIGIYGSFEDLGIIIGPLVYGFVWSATGPVYIFAASAIAQIMAAALVFAIEQKQPKAS
jgi:DHA1 family multidrug resistance protein-like MFS transporter